MIMMWSVKNNGSSMPYKLRRKKEGMTMRTLLNISLEEFKMVAPRLALYSVLVFATIKTVEFTVAQTRKLIDGRDSE